ncbi:MAG: glutathione peroxidase, partial [Flavicella sp.]
KDNFVIIGLPCNQFGKQEPGNNDEILEFCSINYGVSFPISEKVKVKGSNQHPIYRWLTDRALNGKSNSTVKWNFQKYLVDENGYLLDYFYSITKPNSTKITSYLRE